jgi:hypothetical protein
MDMKRQMKMCFFISMMFILIHMKFEIHISNDELLEIIWKHKKWGGKKELIVVIWCCKVMRSPTSNDLFYYARLAQGLIF